MHFSILTVLAAGSLYLTSSSAAPTTSKAPGIAATVNHLDSNNMIHWTPTKDGGRKAIIPAGVISHAHQQLASSGSQRLKVRDGPGADVGGWTNIGEISNYVAAYACEQGGAYGVSTTIASYATDACSNLLSQVPGVPIAEKAWSTYQSATAAGPGDSTVSTIFRFFTNTAQAPPLTQSICTTAITDLTSNFCQGKDTDKGDTQGGEIKIGSGDDYLMFGIDPGAV